MVYTVKVHKNGKIVEKKAEKGMNLLKFLNNNSIEISSPCGGHGTCGKCKIQVEGMSTELSKKESRLLGEKLQTKGYRLACYNSIESDLDIYLDEKREEASIVTEGKKRKIKFDPIFTKKVVELPKPDIHDQRSDFERLHDYFKKSSETVSLDILRELPDALREHEYKVTLLCFGDKLMGVEAGDTTERMFGLAVDIGTTTIAGYLIDLATGEEQGVYSCLNPQRRFGADVISRINYTLESRDKMNEMNALIIECMNDMVQYFVKNTGVLQSEIYTAVFVGNTTMMHFLMNLSAKNIAAAPFIPVTTDLHFYSAKEMGVRINQFGFAAVVPSVSAYIGADTIAAVLSSGMYEDEKVSLLVDIGTNGEVVLGNGKWLYSCSVAAGPAFEGAHIRNGVGGVRGAIDKISFHNDLSYTTIGNEQAKGICGSGIVDAISGMLDRGIIDEMGRIVDEDELDDKTAKEYNKRLIEMDGVNALLIARSEECDADIDIAITQRDIRELQNAKAAIAAGIKTLVKEADIKLDDIDRVYLAGGFGSYINIESALNIGLLPMELKGRIHSIGNAAGSGAVEVLTSHKMIKKALRIKKDVKYIELSAKREFVDEYIECMGFEK